MDIKNFHFHTAHKIIAENEHKKYTKYICEYCMAYNLASTKNKTKLKEQKKWIYLQLLGLWRLEVLCAPYVNISNQVKNKFYLCSTGLASKDFKLPTDATPTALRKQMTYGTQKLHVTRQTRGFFFHFSCLYFIFSPNGQRVWVCPRFLPTGKPLPPPPPPPLSLPFHLKGSAGVSLFKCIECFACDFAPYEWKSVIIYIMRSAKGMWDFL